MACVVGQEAAWAGMLADNLRLLESLAADRLADDTKALRTALQISEEGPSRAPARPCHSCQAASQRVCCSASHPCQTHTLSLLIVCHMTWRPSITAPSFGLTSSSVPVK